MRRRPRIDLGSEGPSTGHVGQGNTSRDEEIRERKRKRWADVNKNRPPEENPFLAAIKPNHENYGDPSESTEELRSRLESLEFGNYPGYFNYRNKAATTSASQASNVLDADKESKQSRPESHLEDGLTDERLRLMKGEWFRGKDVLDIGCNRGHVTYAIAKLFSPKFILGIDIDLKMINMANRDLHHHLETGIIKNNIDCRIKRAYELSHNGEIEAKAQDEDEQRKEQAPGDKSVGGEKPDHYAEHDHHYPLSSYVTRGPLAVALGRPQRTDCDNGEDKQPRSDLAPADDKREEVQAGHEGPPTAACPFPNNILFVEHNYVLSKDELVDKQGAHFDTIVCLSVTKWIHLNYRDEGLKRFLRRAYRHLKPGGLLVLEAQPFDNYHRKRKLSERLRANFQSIKFKPEQLDDFLLSEEVGFKRIIFSTTTEHECVGFKRPMKVFLK